METGMEGQAPVIRQKQVFLAEACFLLSAESEIDPESHFHCLVLLLDAIQAVTSI